MHVYILFTYHLFCIVYMVKTIRISEKLYEEFLSNVAKGESYSEWILKRLGMLEDITKILQWKEGYPLKKWVENLIQKLVAHEKNAVCWIINKIYRFPASEGNEDGVNPHEENTLSIISEIPELEWDSDYQIPIGIIELKSPSKDYKLFYWGGFACIAAAKTYIENLSRIIKPKPGGTNLEYSIYTSYPKYSKFDKFVFVDKFLRQTKPKIEINHIVNYSKKQQKVKEIIKDLEQKASSLGFGLLPNPEFNSSIYEYCFKQFEKDSDFIFTTEQFNIDLS